VLERQQGLQALHLASSDSGAVVVLPPFKKRPTWRTEICVGGASFDGLYSECLGSPVTHGIAMGVRSLTGNRQNLYNLLQTEASWSPWTQFGGFH